jgi:hypothetical protein
VRIDRKVGEANVSSPVSRDNRLEGHELYAPRNVREKLSDDQPAPWLRLRPRPIDRLPASGSDPWHAEREAVEAQAGVHDAIWEVADAEPAVPVDLDARSAMALSSHDKTGMSPFSFESRLQDRVPAHRAVQSRFRLDPEIVPEPPIETKRRTDFGLLARFSLMIGFAAIVAYGVTMISSSKPSEGVVKRSEGSVPAPQVPSRLVADDQQTFANDPLPLAVAVEHSMGNESLVLKGLAVGSRLSAGEPIGPSGWHLAANQLRGLYLYAPSDFVGVMNTGLDLLAPDKQLLDSRAVRLKWVAKDPPPLPARNQVAKDPAPLLPPNQVAKDPAPLLPSNQVASAVPDGLPIPVLPAVQPMDPAEAAMLMSQGQDFLKAGDIEAARIGFGRLADAGNADGALALASTYDPRYLAEHNVVGVRGDDAKARALYQRARDLGSTEAGRILDRMVRK